MDRIAARNPTVAAALRGYREAAGLSMRIASLSAIPDPAARAEAQWRAVEEYLARL